MAKNLTGQIGDAIIARLGVAFNSNFATLASGYGISPITISFVIGNNQFFRGAFTEDDVEENCTSLEYPYCMVYFRRAVNTRETKPAKFAGTVEFGIDFVHGFPLSDIGLSADYETVMDCTMDTMIECFNTGIQTTFPQPISYPGKIEEIGRSVRRLSDREQEYTRRQNFVLGFYTRK